MDVAEAASPTPDLPSCGGGEASNGMARIDWAATEIGPAASWSAALRTLAARLVAQLDRQLGEAWAQRERERLQQLFAQSPGFMATLEGPDHVHDLMNPAYRQLIGHRDLTGMAVRQAFPEIEGQGLFELLDRVYATGEAHSGLATPISFRPRAGAKPEQRFVDFVFQPMRDRNHRVHGIFLQGSDVSACVLAEQRLRRAQQAGGVGTFTLDLTTDRVSGTAEFFRIFGLPECGEVAAADLEALVLSGDAALRSASTPPGDPSAAQDVEYRVRRRSDGAVRWIARRAEYERDGDGRATSLVGAVLDITERKAAQAALAESENQFRTLAQALPTHVWTARSDGRLDWLNDRLYQYTGMAPGELDGEAWTHVVHPDDVAGAGERWAAAIAGGQAYEVEFRLRRADGAFRWHLTRALPLRSAETATIRWIGTNTDIHERKLAEARSNRDRDRIWSLSQEIMLVCDFGGTITAVNPSATRLLGWAEHELVGQTLASFLHPDDLARTAAEVDRLARGETTISFENRYRARDGSHRLFDWTAVPDAGRIHAVGRDVTRERMAEESLRQSQKMEAVGQLTGGVAHDFNNLLSIIQTSIELLRRPEINDERRQQFMGSISRAVDRAAKLTGQLLAFARRQSLHPTDLDAAASVRAVSEMIGTLVGARIDVVLRVGNGCQVHADPSQFDAAIVNMAVNARDAMNGAGQLTVDVRRTDAIAPTGAHPAIAGDFVVVSLTDTGTGIAPEHLERIFEPFFTTKQVGLGTGLGLSQVFGFARQSGGEVRVESEVGRGSRFMLYLPRASATPVATEAPAPPEAVPGGSGETVLVVEDNAELAASVAETLHEIGYRATIATSAESALTEIERSPDRFALVFTDVVMAGMNGIEFAQAVRERFPAIPIVLSSGYSEVLARQHDHGFHSAVQALLAGRAVAHAAPGVARARRAGGAGRRLDRLGCCQFLRTRDASRAGASAVARPAADRRQRRRARLRRPDTHGRRAVRCADRPDLADRPRAPMVQVAHRAAGQPDAARTCLLRPCDRAAGGGDGRAGREPRCAFSRQPAGHRRPAPALLCGRTTGRLRWPCPRHDLRPRQPPARDRCRQARTAAPARRPGGAAHGTAAARPAGGRTDRSERCRHSMKCCSAGC